MSYFSSIRPSGPTKVGPMNTALTWISLAGGIMFAVAAIIGIRSDIQNLRKPDLTKARAAARWAIIAATLAMICLTVNAIRGDWLGIAPWGLSTATIAATLAFRIRTHLRAERQVAERADAAMRGQY